MSDVVMPQVTAVAVHQRASSACCAAPLNEAAAEAPHDFECGLCGQPTVRVLGEPKYIPVTGSLVALPEGGA